MPKKSRYSRKAPLDPVYGNELAAKFINSIMRQGKKGAAERIFYGAIDFANTKAKGTGLEILEKAMSSVRPSVATFANRRDRPPGS